MSEFSKWISSVLAVAIIGFAVDLFLGETRLKKFTRVATAAVTLLIVITPIQSVISGGTIDFSGFTFGYDTKTDEKYAEFVAEKKRNVLAAAVERALTVRGLKNAEVKVKNDGDEILIEINLSDCVIDEKNEHINKNELARSVVCVEMGIDESRVTIYG